MDLASLDSQLTPSQRLWGIYGFVVLGLVIALQVAQTQAEEPLTWTNLTKDTALFWVAIYVLELLLLLQSSYPILQKNMDGLLSGNEDQILNGIWIGLLSVEALMVLGVAAQSVLKRFGPRPKQKTY